MKFDIKLINYITFFENFTKLRVKDCFIGQNKEIVFVVKNADLGKAIGKNGSNVKKLGYKMKKKLIVLGYDDNPKVFVKNLLYPLNEYEVLEDDGKIILKTENNVIKGKIYGRDRSRLKWINEVFSRYFKDLKVVVE